MPNIEVYSEYFKHDRHLGNEYQNHSQNLTLDTAIEVWKQQKQFFDTVVKEFAQAFKAQIGKIIKILKAKEEKQNNLITSTFSSTSRNRTTQLS